MNLSSIGPIVSEEKMFEYVDGRRTPESAHLGAMGSSELEWSQHFTHYTPMGAICCHGHNSSDPI